MRDLTPEVQAALKSVCCRTYFFYPNSFNTLPVISFYDQANAGSNDDVSEAVAFQVDVWDKTVGGCKSLAGQVDEAMRGLGFHRALMQSLSDPSGYRRQTMRFEGTYNALDQKLYPGG